MRLDLNVYLGQWPFRRLRYAGAAGVRQLMARAGVQQALAFPLQAAFYKDCLDGVMEMVEDIGSQRDLLPLAVINPRFPGWEQDLEQMVGGLGCAACGVIPNYHGYRVYDRCAGDLFRKLGEMSLPALLFMRLWDERSHHWCMQVPPLAVEDVTYVLKTFPDIRLAVCNANLPAEGVPLAPSLTGRAHALLTTGYKSLNLREVIERIGAEHVAYGSGAPMYYPESALYQILDADIDDGTREQILGRNARSFLGLEGGDGC